MNDVEQLSAIAQHRTHCTAQATTVRRQPQYQQQPQPDGQQHSTGSNDEQQRWHSQPKSGSRNKGSHNTRHSQSRQPKHISQRNDKDSHSKRQPQ